MEVKTGRRRPRLSAFSEADRWERSREQPYLSIKRLNDRLDSYALQFEAATVSKTSAKRQQNKQRFEKRYADALGKLSSEERSAILEAQNGKKSTTD